ncbi:PepSY domain-containing protein, partial [Rosenbergiella collisarenosi]|uniref:PepSY domain-containing protein n=1 Tax=Rosenbergiella collisarenosi TaxID=1544695 RepID=UPI0030C8118E
MQRPRKASFSMRWHRRLGGVLLLGMVFLSATGITWSQWAGDNVNQLRHAFGWLTPQVTAVIGDVTEPAPKNAHAAHQAMDMGSMPGMDMS